MASAPTFPTGLVATNVHSDGSLDLSWNPSTNPAALKTGGWTGCLWGWTGSLPDVLLMETKTGRAAGMFREYLFSTGQSSQAPLNSDDKAMAGFGTQNKLSDGTSTLFNGAVVNRVPYMNMTSNTNGGTVNASLWGGTAPLPACNTKDFGGTGTNDVWSPLQIGQVDINGNVTGTRTTTVTATSGSPNITGTFTSADVGLPVTDGTKIPTGAIIISQTGSAAVLNQNATASGSVSVTLGAGVLDPLITSWVNQFLAFPGQAFFNWNHEVDVMSLVGKAGTGTTAHYSCGVPSIVSAIIAAGSSPITIQNAQLQAAAAARRYIIKKFRDAGATNAIFPWIIGGFRAGPSNNFYQQIYPGSGWCDWIGWDPYDHTPANAPGGPGSDSAGKFSLMYSQSNGWYAGLDPDPFETDWVASHTYAVNAYVVPTVANGHFYKATSITTGTSSGTQPTWPTTSGGTVVDAGVTWTEQGLSSGGKPRMLGEVGCQYRTNNTRASVFFNDLVTAQTNFPKMKAATYYAPTSSATTWSGLHVTGGAWDTNAIAKLSSSTTGLNNSLFLPNITTGGSGVGSYKIYDGVTNISSLTGNPSAPTKHLTGLATGAHSLSVTSLDTSGTPLESAKSAPLPVTIPSVAPTAPAAPVITVVAASNAPQALVSWAAVTGAGGYNVYRSDDNGTTWILRTTTPLPASTLSYTSTTLVANPSPAYKFKVRALDSTLQVESVDSNIVSFSSTGTNPSPSAVTNLQVSLSTSGSSSTANLFWSLPTDPLIAGVQVFYLDPNVDQTGTLAPIITLPPTAGGWTDPGTIIGGQSQTWYVVTVSAAGQISSTASVTAVAPAGIVTAVLSAPTLQLTLPATGGATFTYDARGSSTSLAGASLTYTFSDPQNSSFLLGPTTNGIASRTFFSPGNYQTQVTVTDGTNTATSPVVSVLVTYADGNIALPFSQAPRILNNDQILTFDPSNLTASVWSKIIQTFETFDALLGSLFTVPASGDYIYNVGMTTPGTNTYAAGFNGIAQWVRMLVPGGVTFNRIGVNLNNTPAGGTQSIQFAIYADDGTGKTPAGSPLATSATVNLLTTAGWVEDTTGFSWTAPNSTGQWSYVWAMALFTASGGTTYATLSTASSSLILPTPQTGSVIFPRGYQQSGLASPPSPIVPASLNRTAAPIAIGMKVA